MERHSNNAAAAWPPLMVTHPRCESSAVKKLNFLLLFLYPNATVMIWASQIFVRQVPCLDSMKMSSSLKSPLFLVSCVQSPLLVQWKTLTGSNCWYPLNSLQISMRGSVVEGVLAAACQAGVTATCCKDYQNALLLHISITEKFPSDKLWEPEAKQRMSPSLHQVKVSEPRQMDRPTPVRENFVPAPCC